jgi:hypothetical protein
MNTRVLIRQLTALVQPASPHARASIFVLAITATALCGGARADLPAPAPQGVQLFFDRTGIIGTLDVNGPVNEKGAFFQSLGTNGRSCATARPAMSQAKP